MMQKKVVEEGLSPPAYAACMLCNKGIGVFYKVCMHMCDLLTHAYTHAYTHVYIHVHTHVYTHAYTKRPDADRQARLRACAHTRLRTHL